jgi:hypothetical protein
VGIYPTAWEGLRDPAWFASRAAYLARDYVAENAAPKDRPRVRATEQLAQWLLFCEVIGDPLATARQAPVKLAQHPAIGRLLTTLDSEGSLDPFTLLALADAVEEAGCTDQALLSHLRQKEQHFAGCWAVERVAGREMIKLPVDEELIYLLEEGSGHWWDW